MKSEKKWVAVLGVALVGALAIFGLQFRKYRLHSAQASSITVMSCVDVCLVGCQKDHSCGGFKGDCTPACRERCANSPAPHFMDPPHCWDKLHSLTCDEADRLGQGDANVLGAACNPFR